MLEKAHRISTGLAQATAGLSQVRCRRYLGTLVAATRVFRETQVWTKDRPWTISQPRR